MKKLIFAAMILTLALSGCGGKSVPECVQSSAKAVWKNRVYETAYMENAWFLTYTLVSGDSGERFYACSDPLCQHKPFDCAAFSGCQKQIAVVPKQKGCEIYFFRDDDPMGSGGELKLVALDLAEGSIRKVTDVESYGSTNDFLIGGDYVWFTKNTLDNNHNQSMNIFRAPLSGGKTEQVTFADDIKSGCRVEFYEDGYVYYRRGNTLVRSEDFASEEVIREDLDLFWDVQFHDGWLYYSDNLETVVYKADEPMPGGYDNVYDYTNDFMAGYADSRNSCSIMRLKLDGSGTTEKLIDGVKPGYRVDSPAWTVANGVLYCVPCDYVMKGRRIFSEYGGSKSLSYIWSDSDGTLFGVDTETKEKKVILTDAGYDIAYFDFADDGRLFVRGRVYDPDLIEAYYKDHTQRGSVPNYEINLILDSKTLKAGK